MRNVFPLLPAPFLLAGCLATATAPPSPAPVRTGPSTIPAASPVSDAYRVDANLPYDRFPQTVADILSPKAPAPSGEKRPAVILFHGRGTLQSDKAYDTPWLYDLFLARGFVVCNANYRSPTNGNVAAPIAVHDAYTVTRWFYDQADQYNIDKSKISIAGISSGGLLALLVGMAPPDSHLGTPPSPSLPFPFASIIDAYGPSDLPSLIDNHSAWTDQWIPPSTPDRASVARAYSPSTYIRKDLPPLFILSGTRDQVFPYSQAEVFTKSLQVAGADAQLHAVVNAYHGFAKERIPEVSFELFDTFLAHHGIIKPTNATGPAPYRGVPPYN
jgi:acetyl esterase/lipase